MYFINILILLLSVTFLINVIIYTSRPNRKNYYKYIPNYIFSEYFVYTLTVVSFIGLAVLTYKIFNKDSPYYLYVLFGMICVFSVFVYYNLYYDTNTNIVTICSVFLLGSILILTGYAIYHNIFNRLLILLCAIPAIVFFIFTLYAGSFEPDYKMQVHYIEINEDNTFKNLESKVISEPCLLLEFSKDEAISLIKNNYNNLEGIFKLSEIIHKNSTLDIQEFESITPVRILDDKIVYDNLQKSNRVFLLVKLKNKSSEILKEYRVISLLAYRLAYVDSNYKNRKKGHSNIKNYYKNYHKRTSDTHDETNTIRLLSLGENHGGIDELFINYEGYLTVNNTKFQQSNGIGPIDSTGKYLQFGISSDSVSDILKDPYTSIINSLLATLFPSFDNFYQKTLSNITFPYPSPNGPLISINDLNFSPSLDFTEGPATISINSISGLGSIQIDETQSGASISFCSNSSDQYLEVYLVMKNSDSLSTNVSAAITGTDGTIGGNVSIFDLNVKLSIQVKIPITTTTNNTTLNFSEITVTSVKLLFESGMVVVITIPIISVLYPVTGTLIIDGIANIVVNMMTTTLANLLSGVLQNLIQNSLSSLNLPDFSLGIPLPTINCTVFQAEIPATTSILDSYTANLISYKTIPGSNQGIYVNTNFSFLNPRQYVNIDSSTTPSIVAESTDYNYNCPSKTVPIVSYDNSYNGCYSCPTGTSMVLTRGRTPHVLNFDVVYSDSYTDTGYLSKIICATNIVQPLNDVVSNKTPALYNESNLNIDYTLSLDYSVCQASYTRSTTQGSSNSFTMNNNTNIKLPADPAGKSNDYNNYYNTVDTSSNSLGYMFNVNSSDPDVTSGTYYCAGVAKTQMNINTKKIKITGQNVSYFHNNDVPPLTSCIPDDATIKTYQINEVFCGDSETLIKNSDITRTAVNLSLIPTLSDELPPPIMVPISPASGSLIVVNFNANVPVSLDIFSPTCTILMYGVDNSNNKTLVDFFSSRLNSKYIKYNSTESTTFYVNNPTNETLGNFGISLQGYRFMNYRIVGSGGAGGTGEFDNSLGIDLPYYGGGGGGSGNIKGNAGANTNNNGFSYSDTSLDLPDFDLYSYQNSKVKTFLSQNGSTTLYIDSTLIDSASGGQQGYDGGSGANGGDGGSGANGGGAAGRYNFTNDELIVLGAGGVGTLNSGQPPNITTGEDPTIQNAGNGGGAGGIGGLNVTSINMGGGGGGGPVGINTPSGTYYAGNGAVPDYDSTTAVSATSGADYTGAGGGGGGEGYTNANLNLPLSPIPGAGGKGYAIIELTSYQYQYSSNFPHDPSKYLSYTADIIFN
jgi:hypothetical protein